VQVAGPETGRARFVEREHRDVLAKGPPLAALPVAHREQHVDGFGMIRWLHEMK
jgi:hypothetical protein